jgi:hypothetical protein
LNKGGLFVPTFGLWIKQTNGSKISGHVERVENMRVFRVAPKFILSACIALLCVFSLNGCGNGWDNAKCLQAVQAAFDGSSVFSLPDAKYRFIVKDTDGSIWYVKTMGEDTTVTTKLKVF